MKPIFFILALLSASVAFGDAWDDFIGEVYTDFGYASKTRLEVPLWLFELEKSLILENTNISPDSAFFQWVSECEQLDSLSDPLYVNKWDLCLTAISTAYRSQLIEAVGDD